MAYNLQCILCVICDKLEYYASNNKRALEKKILEGHHLDYKQQLSGNNRDSEQRDKQHREFLKDVTAFANANGGNIIIGAFTVQSARLLANDLVAD